MNDDASKNVFNDTKSKDQIIKELQQELNKVKKQLDEIKINRTVEINKLVKDKARFIDNLSHDLATPLTPLISLLPVIKDDVENENSKKLLETCLKNIKYIKRVIENARELADVSATDLLLKKENLYDILNEILNRYDIVFKSYNIKIQNNIDRNTLIKTEKTRLLQLFDNLISNAVNSMLDGGVLTFESKCIKNENGNFIQVIVKDTGVGLTRDQTDRIFNEFYKTDDSRHKLDSTGLGLTICKKIVEKHGGKIWADSHGKDMGTRIIFTIPSKEVVYTRSF